MLAVSDYVTILGVLRNSFLVDIQSLDIYIWQIKNLKDGGLELVGI